MTPRYVSIAGVVWRQQHLIYILKKNLSHLRSALLQAMCKYNSISSTFLLSLTAWDCECWKPHWRLVATLSTRQLQLASIVFASCLSLVPPLNMLKNNKALCVPWPVVNLSASVNECLMSTREDSVLALIAVHFLPWSDKRGRQIGTLSRKIPGVKGNSRHCIWHQKRCNHVAVKCRAAEHNLTGTLAPLLASVLLVQVARNAAEPVHELRKRYNSAHSGRTYGVTTQDT